MAKKKDGTSLSPMMTQYMEIKEQNKEKFEWVKSRVIAELNGEVPDSMKITVIDSVIIR